MKLRARHSRGTDTLSLGEDATVADLMGAILSVTGSTEFVIKAGYPPKPIDIGNASSSLSSLGIRNGEQLILTEISKSEIPQLTTGERWTGSSVPENKVKKSQDGSHLEIELPDGQYLTVRIMPDDNSCLFRSVSYVLMPALDTNPTEFSDAILGMPRAQYCRHIKNENSWGGAIELAIFAKHFGTEICSVDVATGRVDRFECNNLNIFRQHIADGATQQCYILYSGIHYGAHIRFVTESDAIALSPMQSGPSEFDQTVFPKSQEDLIQTFAQKLADELRQQHYYTDTATFSLRCNDCGIGIKGQAQAQEHAKKTGHIRFGEYD